MPTGAETNQQRLFETAELRQFGLKALLVATAFISIELAIVRIAGRVAVPACVHLTATAALLVWTRGWTWRGARIGFAAGGCLAGFLLFESGAATFQDCLLMLMSFSSFGSWIGVALHGMERGHPVCALALLLACYWAAIVIGVVEAGTVNF